MNSYNSAEGIFTNQKDYILPKKTSISAETEKV